MSPHPSRSSLRRSLAALTAAALVAAGLVFGATPALADDTAQTDVSTTSPAEGATPEGATPGDPIPEDSDAGQAPPAADEAGAVLPAPENSAEAPAEEPTVPASDDAQEPSAGTTAPVTETDAPVAARAPAAPTVELTATSGLDPAGQEITVTGSGFNTTSTAPSYYGVPGLKSGFYVQIGWIGDNWKPSAGGKNGVDRASAYSAWVSNSAPASTIWSDPVTGAFSWTVEIDKKTLDAAQLANATLAVFTTAAAGGPGAENETSTPISFAPVLSVSQSSGLDPAGQEITVTGSGFNTSSVAPSYYGVPGLKSGFYVQIGWIGDNWKPSAGGKNGVDRASAYSAWVSNSAPASLVWTDAVTGAFSWTVEIDKKTLDAATLSGARLAVFSTAAAGGPAAANEAAVPLAFGPQLAVSSSTGLDPAGADVTITGSGFNTSSVAPSYYGVPGLKSGFYVQIGWIGENWKPSAGGKSGVDRIGVESQWVSNSAPASLVWSDPVTGAFSWTARIDKATLDAKKVDGARLAVFTTAAAGGPAAENETFQLLEFADPTVPETPGPGPGTPTPGTPGTPATPGASTPIGAGSLSWSISAGFERYIIGPIAHGSVTVSNGATKSGGRYQFGQAAGSTWSSATGTGIVAYTGAVRFTGHNGILDLTFANPVLDVAGDRGTLTLTVNGSRVVFATLGLAGAQKSTANGAVTWSGASVSLTPAATALFDGHTFDPDPISFTIGATGAAPAGSAGTVASAPVAATRATPVTERTLALPGASCTVESSTLDWGFKESFRNYIESIAHGSWEVGNGASYDYPFFSFAGTSGGYDPATATGGTATAGSVRFTGHDGALDTTIANPQIELVDETSAYLLVDVTGTTQDGEPMAVTGIRFAALDLSAGTVESDATSIAGTSIPATLTADGASAFGTYPVGEALDDVTFALTFAPDCAAPAVATSAGEESSDAGATADAGTPVAAEEFPVPAWLLWSIGIFLVLAAAGAIALTAMRKRATPTAD